MPLRTAASRASAFLRLGLAVLFAASQSGRAEDQVIPGLERIEEAAEFFEIDELPEESRPDGGQGSGADPEPQTLQFADGTSLHGKITGIDATNQTVSWERRDAAAPLTFPLRELRALELGNEPTSPLMGGATVKFTGGDWLAAKVTGLDAESVSLQLADASQVKVKRDQVEWIYFSKSAAPECYDGPTSLAGWVSDGSWTFRDGALRTSRPAAIGRQFESLPDKVEYLFEFNQKGNAQSFSLTLGGSQVPMRGVGAGRIQIMFSGNELRLWAQVGEEMKMEQVDLRQVLGPPGKPEEYRPPRNRTVRYRVFIDQPAGRVVVFIDDRKAAEWKIASGEAGKNRGGMTFQPMSWERDSEQLLTRVRVMPWDGRLPAPSDEEDRGHADVAVLTNGELREGDLVGISESGVELREKETTTAFTQDQLALVRFRRPENPPDEDPPIARFRLASTGEFDAAQLEFRDHDVLARTAFSQELVVPIAAVRNIEFLRGSSIAPASQDVLVFRNGDRLRGKLMSADHGHSVVWQSGRADPVQLTAGGVAGVILSGDAIAVPSSKAALVARFRNGDLLSGTFLSLDATKVSLATAQMGSVSVPREFLQALYFSRGEAPPVLDGSMNSDAWISGDDFRQTSAQRNKTDPQTTRLPSAKLWRYFDGTYTIGRPSPAEAGLLNRGNLLLGRILASMPQSVEVSFTISSPKVPPAFMAQLFTEPENPGYMMQFYSEGILLHDTAPRPRGGAVFQQQVLFEGKVKKEAVSRQIRILADRPSGKLVVTVDGVIVANVVRKRGERIQGLGRGIAFYPQMNTPCTFSSIWIGPWDGQTPGLPPADAGAPHAVLLANGDESHGTIQSADPETVRFEGDVGAIEMPTSRVTMLRLADPGAPSTSARLRFAGMGTLSVSEFRVAEGNITFKSPLTGEATLPLSAVSEIAFARPAQAGAKAKLPK